MEGQKSGEEVLEVESKVHGYGDRRPRKEEGKKTRKTKTYEARTEQGTRVKPLVELTFSWTTAAPQRHNKLTYDPVLRLEKACNMLFMKSFELSCLNIDLEIVFETSSL